MYVIKRNQPDAAAVWLVTLKPQSWGAQGLAIRLKP
jgi:hypothetical protein